MNTNNYQIQTYWKMRKKRPRAQYWLADAALKLESAQGTSFWYLRAFLGFLVG
jgi:hypothetical protein